MKVRYRGKSFGIDGLTDGKIYDVVCIDSEIGALRVIDDSGEDYLYSPKNPRPAGSPDHPGGRWIIVQDDADGSLGRIIS